MRVTVTLAPRDERRLSVSGSMTPVSQPAATIAKNSRQSRSSEPANGGDKASSARKNAAGPHSLEPTTFSDDVRPAASDRDKRCRPDSNRGWRICNQATNGEKPAQYADSQASAAQFAAVSAECGSVDPGLSRIIVAWPTLPDEVKQALLAILSAIE